MTKKVIVLLITLVFVLGVASTAWAQVGDSSITADGGLAGTLNVGAGQIKLSWTNGQAPEQAWVPVWLGTEYTIGVTAENQGGEIAKVLYIVEITRNGASATPDDVLIKGTDLQTRQTYDLGYDSTGRFFYWGDRNNGFTFPGGGILKAEFSVTFKKAGTYTYKIYAVQLP
ncbi:MAG: hypothetical protein HPY90_09955 [Syntrophothermus sp.]|uniref:hypothetical protein n=1 Tax=Syntrophothermus sp. TaxID=2736299 RepID=UPI00257A24CE|nr:hypothetical protein [Syntrophothermus sp.]NSW83575.1 hypothetical protein [Syntrophothermus sp.]